MPLLEIGAHNRLQIREVCLPRTGYAPTTLLYASDLHLSRWSPHIAAQLVEAVETVLPDIILLGGDLVDAPNGFPYLSECIQRMVAICPVWAISGNHDEMVGLNSVRNCVVAAGAKWLDGTFCQFNRLRIDGKCQAAGDSFSILCAHDPAIFPQAADCNYDLVLAGHLHGSQCVLFRRDEMLYPGAWFFTWNGDQFQQGRTTMIVSRGMNDTLPARWNCPREVIVCRIG